MFGGIELSNNWEYVKERKQINGFYINLSVLRWIHRKHLKKFLSLLKHEKIHSKLFKIIGIRKTRITIHYIYHNKIFYFYGRCKALGKVNVFMLFIIDFVQFIYDIICDILNLSLILISEHFMDFFKDFKKNIKKI